MKITRLFILFVIIFNNASSVAITNDSYHLAKELAHIINVKKTLIDKKEREMIDIIIKPRLEGSSHLSDDKFKAYENDAIESMKNIYNSEAYKDQAFRIYVQQLNEYYSPKELKAMIEFYKTPIGQNILKKQSSFDQQVYHFIGVIIESFNESEEIKEVVHGTYVSMIISDLDNIDLTDDEE